MYPLLTALLLVVLVPYVIDMGMLTEQRVPRILAHFAYPTTKFILVLLVIV